MVALDWVRTRTGMRRLMETGDDARALAGRVARRCARRRARTAIRGTPGGRTGATSASVTICAGCAPGFRLLAAGEALAVFPRAYPNVDSGLDAEARRSTSCCRFRPGFASLAHGRGDVRVSGCRRADGLSFGGTTTARWAVTIRFGDPLVLGARGTPATLVAEAERCVAELSDVPAPRPRIGRRSPIGSSGGSGP
jgi:hypothetical protein